MPPKKKRGRPSKKTEGMHEEKPEEIPEDAPEEMPEEVPKDMPKEVPKDMPEEVPKDKPEDVPKETPKEDTKDKPEEVLGNVPEEVPKDTKEVPEQKPEPKAATSRGTSILERLLSSPEKSLNRSEFKDYPIVGTSAERLFSGIESSSSSDSKEDERSKLDIPSTSSSGQLSSPENKDVKSDKREDKEDTPTNNVFLSPEESENESEKYQSDSHDSESADIEPDKWGLGGENSEGQGLGREEMEPPEGAARDEREPEREEKEPQKNERDPERETEGGEKAEEEEKRFQLRRGIAPPTVLEMLYLKLFYYTHPLELLFCFALALILKLHISPPTDELDWALFIIISMVTLYAIIITIVVIVFRWLKNQHIMFRLLFLMTAGFIFHQLSKLMDSIHSPVRYLDNPYKAAYYLAPFLNNYSEDKWKNNESNIVYNNLVYDFNV